ncbi:MAG: hypothetical protein V4614_16645 [Pseudomonadota bacterium]
MSESQLEAAEKAWGLVQGLENGNPNEPGVAIEKILEHALTAYGGQIPQMNRAGYLNVESNPISVVLVTFLLNSLERFKSRTEKVEGLTTTQMREALALSFRLTRSSSGQPTRGRPSTAKQDNERAVSAFKAEFERMERLGYSEHESSEKALFKAYVARYGHCYLKGDTHHKNMSKLRKLLDDEDLFFEGSSSFENAQGQFLVMLEQKKKAGNGDKESRNKATLAAFHAYYGRSFRDADPSHRKKMTALKSKLREAGLL